MATLKNSYEIKIDASNEYGQDLSIVLNKIIEELVEVSNG